MALKCPGCGSDGVPGADGKVVCSACGGSFTFTEGEARLADVAEFDQLKKKVEEQSTEISELKKQLGQEPTPAKPSEDPPEDLPEDEEADDEDEF